MTARVSPAGRPWPVSAWQRVAARGEIPLEPRSARVTFSVRWMGVLTVRGWFEDVRGVLRVPDGDPARAEIHVDVATASVRTGIGLRDRHLRGQSFLDAAVHPLVTFRSTGVSVEAPDLDVRALVTVRGRTAAVRLACATSEHDGVALQVVGHATLSRRTFGVGAPSAMAALNPLYWVIGDRVQVRVELRIGLS